MLVSPILFQPHHHHNFPNFVYHIPPPKPATTIVRWTFPPHGWFKLNTDGSLVHGRGSFGGLIRDDVGAWVCGFTGNIPGAGISSLVAEVWGIYKGLMLIKSLGIKNVLVETDCVGAMDLFSRMELGDTHPQKGMIEHGRVLMKECHAVIVHTLREGNHCADQLAKLGRRQREEFSFLAEIPSSVIPFLLADANGVGFERPPKIRRH